MKARVEKTLECCGYDAKAEGTPGCKRGLKCSKKIPKDYGAKLGMAGGLLAFCLLASVRHGGVR